MSAPPAGDETAVPPPDRPVRRGAAVYRWLLAFVAVCVTIVCVKVAWLAHDAGLPLAVLIGLGIVSATTLDNSTEGVNYSFTSFVLTSSFALVGPTGAVIIGLVVPLFEKTYRWSQTHLFNTALIVIVAGMGGFGYRLSSGWLMPDSGDPSDLVLHVGLPLLVANVVVLVLNALIVAMMIKLDGGQFQYVLAGAIRQTAPLYLGYTVLAFLFVVLWGPGKLYELSVALIMAPLLIARWSYMQYGEEFRAHNRILDALATAGDGWDRGGTGHGARVEDYTHLMAEHLGLSFTEQRDLRYASKLHDIGRLGTPRLVLERPMPARDEHDRALIARHSILAAEIVGGIEFLSEAARDIRHHHERVDGLGYPDGLVGDQIPIVSRIVAVADAFDALTSGAGPLDALEPHEAYEVLQRGAGTLFDPECVEAFGHALGRTHDMVRQARLMHDDRPWRDHDDPRVSEYMVGVSPRPAAATAAEHE